MKLFGSKTPAQHHSVIPMDQLMRLAAEVEDISEEGLVKAGALQDLSDDLGVPNERLYAALGASPHLQIEVEHAVQFVVCSGSCQERGSLVALRKLLTLAEDRIEEGAAAFDVIPRQCLSRCQMGPAAEVRTPDGTAILTALSPDLAEAAVAEVFE